MTELPKTHRLVFRRDSLESILAGRKTATVRLAERAYLIEAGHRLELLCGRGDAAVAVSAVATRVERVYLDLTLGGYREEAYLEALTAHGVLALDEHNEPDDEAEPELYEETRGGVSVALIEASEATGGDLTKTVERMLGRQLGMPSLIWWRLGTPGLVSRPKRNVRRTPWNARL